MSSLYILLREALKLTEKSAYTIPIITFKKIEQRIELHKNECIKIMYFEETIHFSSCRHGRHVHNYFLLLLCKLSIWFTEQHIFKIIISLFNTSKYASNYVVLFEVYDGFISLIEILWPFLHNKYCILTLK